MGQLGPDLRKSNMMDFSATESQAGNSCKDCGLEFNSKVQLEEHMKVNHRVVLGVYCQNCPKHFKNKKTLNNHKNKKHTGTKKLSIQIEDYSENDVYNDSDVSDEEDFGDVKEDNKKEDDKAIDSL